METALLCCCSGEGFAAATALCVQARSRPSPSFSRVCSIGRNSYRFPFGQSVEQHMLSSKRNVEVCVAADYSDSKPESFKRRGKWGYHPLEDLSKVEKEELEHAGDGKLTEAEVARTISEVNWSAIVYSSVVTENDAVFGVEEVQYLVDDHGDLYFEVEDDATFRHNLSSTKIYTLLVGFGNSVGLQFSELLGVEEDDDSRDESDSEEDSSDESDNAESETYWETMDNSEDMDDEYSEESFGSLGGWSGFQSLDHVHPMEFATKVSEAVSADHIADIDKPARRLTITGVVRPVTEEEEPYVQGIWYDRFLVSEDGDDEEDEVSGHDSADAGSVALNKAKDSQQDQGTIYAGDTEVNEASSNGRVVGRPLYGTPIADEEDVDLRSKSLGTSELSASDYSVIDLPSSSSGNPGIELDATREGHREGSDTGYVSRDLGTRTNRNMTRGSLLDSSDVEDEALEVEATEIVLPPGATLEGDTVIGEWTERTKSSGACFYKLDITSIILDSASGVQSVIEVRDFAYAEPDILAHFSSALIDRVNGGGKKTENALKALCQRAKDLDVEEVSIVGIDCLGVDLRVRCGIEVQTIRIPFSRRATCEETAGKLLDQLLFPRIGQRRPRKRNQEWNSH